MVSISAAQERAKYADTFDYIGKTGKLWGVEQVLLNSDGTVTLIDARRSGYGHGLMMLDGKRNVVERAVLSVNQTCLLTDGDHAFISYEFNAASDGLITFTVTNRFDARSFGQGVKEEKRTFRIQPYR